MKKETRDEYIKWVGAHFRSNRDVVMTLNFRARLREERLMVCDAEKTLRRFKNGLDRSVFGTSMRRGPMNRLNFFAVAEGSTARDGTIPQLHYHAIIQCPKGRNTGDWMDFCEEEWKRLDWADPNSLDVRRYTKGTFIDYMMKAATKLDPEDFICINTLSLT